MPERDAFEQSTAGRVVLTVVMAVLAGAVLLWNLPTGLPQLTTRDVAAPVVLPVGLDQDWALFAPNPRGFTVGVYARVELADGRELRWDPPDSGTVLAPYRTYRWQKFVERLRADDQRGMWEPTARWIAGRYADAGSDVVRVELVRTFHPTLRPGDDDDRGQPREFAYYVLEVDPSDADGA